jgi:hypothetical protein
MHTKQPTDMVANSTLTTPLGTSAPTAPDGAHIEDLEVRAAAAASYAALSVATQHWAAHGGDLATHIRVALRGLRHATVRDRSHLSSVLSPRGVDVDGRC